MNQVCQLLGHEWGKWTWIGGASDTFSNGKSLGPNHWERRDCVRCKEFESRDGQPGKWSCQQCEWPKDKNGNRIRESV